MKKAYLIGGIVVLIIVIVVLAWSPEREVAVNDQPVIFGAMTEDGTFGLAIDQTHLPEGVLLEDVRIEKVDVDEFTDPETGKNNVLAAYSLEPDGLELKKSVSARMVIELEESTDLNILLHVSKRGEEVISDFSLGRTPEGKVYVDFPISHFSDLLRVGSGGVKATVRGGGEYAVGSDVLFGITVEVSGEEVAFWSDIDNIRRDQKIKEGTTFKVLGGEVTADGVLTPASRDLKVEEIQPGGQYSDNLYFNCSQKGGGGAYANPFPVEFTMIGERYIETGYLEDSDSYLVELGIKEERVQGFAYGGASYKCDEKKQGGFMKMKFCAVCDGPKGSICLQKPIGSKEECDKLGGTFSE